MRLREIEIIEGRVLAVQVGNIPIDREHVMIPFDDQFHAVSSVSEPINGEVLMLAAC